MHETNALRRVYGSNHQRDVIAPTEVFEKAKQQLQAGWDPEEFVSGAWSLQNLHCAGMCVICIRASNPLDHIVAQCPRTLALQMPLCST